jgi:hypothetical protein
MIWVEDSEDLKMSLISIGNLIILYPIYNSNLLEQKKDHVIGQTEKDLKLNLEMINVYQQFITICMIKTALMELNFKLSKGLYLSREDLLAITMWDTILIITST